MHTKSTKQFLQVKASRCLNRPLRKAVRSSNKLDGKEFQIYTVHLLSVNSYYITANMYVFG